MTFSIYASPFSMVVKFLAATSFTCKCIRPVLSVLFHSFSFCWFMLYNRLGRRQTFAMYRQNIVHEWMIVFAVLRGLACEWASWGAGPDGSVFYYQLFTSNFIFQASKNLTFFPSSILHNINWLPPPPPRPSIVKHTLCNGVQPDRGSHCLDISDFCWISQAYAKQNLWFLKCKISE